MFGWRRKKKEPVFQKRMEERFSADKDAERQRRENQKKKRDVTEVLREMEEYARERKLVEWALFVDRARADGKERWLHILLNSSAAYYFRCWLASFKRLEKQGLTSLLSSGTMYKEGGESDECADGAGGVETDKVPEGDGDRFESAD